MKRLALISSLLFVLTQAAYAVTPSETSLKGGYVFQFFQTTENYWSKTVSVKCGGVTATFTGGGQTAATEIVHGVMTFSGAGTESAVFTEYGQFNQAASDDTVTITCSGNPNAPFTENQGHAVFMGNVEGTDTGTYNVGYNGTNYGGLLTFSPRLSPAVGLGKISYDLAGLSSANLFSTMLLRPDETTGEGMGIAVHE